MTWTYGTPTNLSATLTSGASGVSGKTITFKLNGTTLGTATTSASGLATLSSATLAGINAGSYANGVTAEFAGDSGFGSSNATSSLTVNKKELTGSFTATNKVYDGNRDATITGRAPAGEVGADKVSLTGGTATFDTKDVGVDTQADGPSLH